MKELEGLRLLLRQGLPIFDHDSGGKDGNFSQLIKLIDNSWANKGQFQSPCVLNEFIEDMALTVLRNIVKGISSRNYFAILADETRDVANREQLVVCLRWVSECYEVFEDPVGLMEVPNTKADTLLKVMKDIFIRFNLPLSKCRGQGYDGAANFQGQISGVAKIIQEEYPAALPVHCLAHCTNLVLQYVAKQCNVIRDALGFASELIQLIKLSPKRQMIFERIQKEQSNGPKVGIKPLCPTRWTVRTGAINTILNNWEELYATFCEVRDTDHTVYGDRAGGLKVQMEKFQTFFGLQLAVLIFNVAETLSTGIQGKQTSAQDAFTAAKTATTTLTRKRNDAEFKTFFSSVLEQRHSIITDEPILPRVRRINIRIDDGSQNHAFNDVQDYFRKQYYEALDIVINDIKRRFQQDNFTLVSKIEKLLLDAASGNNFTIPDELKEVYARDIDFEKLCRQLTSLQDVCEDESKPIKYIKTICEIFNNSPVYKRSFSEVHILLLIYLTIPVTTATAERTFSVLKRIKTYLRSTMTQRKLNQSLILHIYKSRTDELDLKTIAQDFVSRNTRRQNFFGTFV